jgi:hypothetical protein
MCSRGLSHPDDRQICGAPHEPVSPYNLGMKCKVIPLRADGRILTRAELPDPVVGRLEVVDWGPPWGGKRWSRKAEVLGAKYGMGSVAMLLPIFDPVLAKVDETGLYLTGHQFSADAETGHQCEFVQVWWCVPERA